MRGREPNVNTAGFLMLAVGAIAGYYVVAHYAKTKKLV